MKPTTLFQAKTNWTIAWLLVLLLGTPATVAGRHIDPLPEDRGTAGILAALERLPVYARVLYVTAHPDDESAATLTWLARAAHARTALLSLTRGDGGQNLLGDEKYEAMGLIRTGELVEASRVYGVEPYFSTAFEFGFSKSASETISKWGHEASLEELVRFIRLWRPTVVVSRFEGSPRDGHGHHQAAGQLTHEAFRAAGDRARFPEHLERGLRPWQARKLYRPLPRRAPTRAATAEVAPSGWTLRIDGGAYDPVLGRSYLDIGSEGYRKHRSQGMGARSAPPAPAYDYYELVDATVEKAQREQGFFDSIDRTLLAILDSVELSEPERDSVSVVPALLEQAQAAAAAALRVFQPRHPEDSALEAARGSEMLAEAIREVESSDLAQHKKDILEDALGQKQRDFQAAVSASLGISLTATATAPTAIAGQKLGVKVRFRNRGARRVNLRKVTLLMPEGWVASLPADAPLGYLEPGNTASFEHEISVPPDAQLSQPFWYRENNNSQRYKTRPTENAFAPFDPPLITAKATYRYQGHAVSIRAAAKAAAGDPLRGLDFVDFQVVPALSVALTPAFALAPQSGSGRHRRFQITIESQQASRRKGTLNIQAPAGWDVTPREIPFVIARSGEAFHAAFSVGIPPTAAEGRHDLRVVAVSEGERYEQGFKTVSYPQNWTRRLYTPSQAEILVLDCTVAPDLTVGYVAGAGDEIATAIEQLGAKPHILTGDELAFGDLDRFSAIVTGIRAYNVNTVLAANSQRLLDYVERGGSLIVQYNRPAARRSDVFPYGPFPMTVSSSERITVEESPVRILESGHRLFNVPNRINPADFDGWVQERGTYFMSEWDARYTPLLSGHDPGEEPKEGGMLLARWGKGYFLYTGYSWFRQLPAGVPGAFRIFANMISLKAES